MRGEETDGGSRKEEKSSSRVSNIMSTQIGQGNQAREAALGRNEKHARDN